MIGLLLIFSPVIVPFVMATIEHLVKEPGSKRKRKKRKE